MNIIFNKLLALFPNIIESQFLIWEMLTMLRVGLKGESARELDKLLQLLATEIGINENELQELSKKYFLPTNTDLSNHAVLHTASSTATHTGLQTHSSTITNNNKNQKELWIANRIFIKRSTCLNENFTNVLKNKFACGTQELDFDMPHQAANAINEWVKKATNERIPSIISSHDVGPNTRAVLANAIYFKAHWKQQFEPTDTRSKPFHTDAQQNVLVTMMSQTINARYARLTRYGVEVLELPYRDSDLAMLLILPNEVTTDLSSVAKLTLKDIVNDLVYRTVHINLPKFTFGCTINVHNLLAELGVRGIFHNSQDFSGLIGDNASDFSVSKIIQQAFIKVTEGGTEAAAATTCCIDGPMNFDEQFIANRPFYFCIKNRNCLKLFDGCYRQSTETI